MLLKFFKVLVTFESKKKMDFITAEDLLHDMNQSIDILILDLRSQGDYFSSHIPTAISCMFPSILYRRILKKCIVANSINEFIMCDVKEISERYKKQYIVLYDIETESDSNLEAEVPTMFFYNYFKNIEGLPVKVLKGGINGWISN